MAMRRCSVKPTLAHAATSYYTTLRTGRGCCGGRCMVQSTGRIRPQAFSTLDRHRGLRVEKRGQTTGRRTFVPAATTASARYAHGGPAWQLDATYRPESPPTVRPLQLLATARRDHPPYPAEANRQPESPVRLPVQSAGCREAHPAPARTVRRHPSGIPGPSL